LDKYEPGDDYVVVKFPRWAFDKFPAATNILGTQMKAVGEVMSIGRTFEEAIQKGLRMIGQGMHGFTGNRDLSFEDIEKEVELGDIDKALQQKATPEFLLRYFGFYIFEQIRRVHYEDEIRSQLDGNPDRHFDEIKDYIQFKVRSMVIDEDIANINWLGGSGKAFVRRVIKSVLEVFKK
jgi:hypothetical protein